MSRRDVWFRTLDDVDVSGKTVIVRVDLNSPIDPETGKIRDNERIRAHAETVRELSDKNSRVVLIAHQGRKGDPDFLPLKDHAELLSKHVGKTVKYIPDIIGEDAVRAIKSLKNGEILLLENVRTLDEETVETSPEEHSRGKLVSTLAPLADIFILDAFSVAHRPHASVVGFSPILPTVAGRIMERELRAITTVLEEDRKVMLVIGGNKPEECVKVIDAVVSKNIEDLKYILSGGVLGQLFLMAEGRKLGEPSESYIKKKKFDMYLKHLVEIREKVGDRLKTPVDLAYEEDGRRVEVGVDNLPVPGAIYDIGEKTAKRYAEIILNSSREDAIIVKGPLGAYEREEFRKGTRIVYEALARCKAFTLIGGGDSSTAIELVGLSPKDFSYVSLGGGALITYISERTLPGVEIIRKK
ncbi:MAG: phosphoglycerate kinase [Aigarchaeota archaeon]|nr:phosphoglycerate kinase [Aigarchaeota archaeon]MCX8192377.1 phosphoglycerate kinase [Nitrososphaeria archaeon]MDW7986954.1 phosphoglycerate kinase [Nitrososphaerota archaeon]